MLLFALALAAGPVSVDDSKPPPAAAAVAGVVLGGVGGAAAGVAVAFIGAAIVGANSPCRRAGVVCTDDLNGPMAGLQIGTFAVPLGAIAGAAVGGFTLYRLAANDTVDDP